jgi:hypothetical protein
LPADISSTEVITPVRKNLWGSAVVVSSDLFTQRDGLCGQLHVVYPGRSSCGSISASLYLWREGLYSKAKEEIWIRSRLLWRLIMELNKIKQRLELALRPVEKPTLEEVLEQVSTRGVLRGPVDWVFPAWMLYVEYATQKIAEAFQLTEEERRQLFRFRDAMKKLLLEAQKQAKAKLTSIYRAITEDAYRLEGRRLYAPDDWMYVGRTMYIPIHGVSAVTHFPDVLKLPRERLELF